MKNIYIGLIGWGNIGSGVVKLLKQNEELITKRLGAKIVLKKVADINITSPRAVKIPKNLLTTDAREILNDPEISIVIELMGGYEPARTFVLEAIKKGKQVVTANKAMLATFGNEIFPAAQKKGVDVGFEASVGGTIPIIKTLKEALVANHINSIVGIMNGTCNFILTKMTDEGKPFDVVLKEAQQLGFAEADPTFDIEGIDTSHKMAILLSLAYGKKVNLKDIYLEGITKISGEDIAFAKELGYRIKLLAIGMLKGDAVEARVHPTMISSSHLLANVNRNYNAFHLVGDASGPVFLFGQGAGMMPTASAVFSDILDAARNVLKGISGRVPLRSINETGMKDIKLIPMDDIETKYYFRFSALDQPGVLSKISGILGENNISLATVIQKARQEEGAVPVVMTTYKAKEKNVRRALKKIDKLDIVRDKTILIRIEDEL
ncbi:MAG: homoserine dehydrogenase [Deltaproteobacteria bacterium HGW-Deltaproteobacteria-7]|nr:MAG: homoserine dehydrogenase [Deltaproteobacteria bacterium HGW-Deltaproteobacteria-7]PKN20692.1 MAG: homoserine dehydrogenase [Deltaproteobacteria bacterium HGW-Deltaproteobacteria-6]